MTKITRKVARPTIKFGFIPLGTIFETSNGQYGIVTPYIKGDLVEYNAVDLRTGFHMFVLPTELCEIAGLTLTLTNE